MKKTKKIISGVLTPMAMMPLVSIALVGCNDGNSKLINQLNKDFETEFQAVCAIKRPTFENKDFCNYMIHHIQQLGVRYDQIKIDTEYEPRDPVTGEVYPNHGFNFCYDIPATPGWEDVDGIIFQCHTDMVWKWKEGAESIPTHPIPVKEKDKKGNWIMHSENYCTSLGADDGAGIATCLAITKNANAFEHGPIRMLMTTDEEDGPSGASFIPNEWLKPDAKFKAKYLLNIDLEETNKICQSTAGVQQAAWSKEYDLITNPSHIAQYGIQLIVRGLDGGHAAKVIKEGKVNGIKLAFEILDTLNKNHKDNVSCQIFEAYENQDSSGDSTPGTVPNQMQISFATNYGDWKTLNSEIQQIAENLRNKYPNDNHFEVLVSEADIPDISANNGGVLKGGDSLQLIKLVNDTLKYEVSEYLDPDTMQSPATSYNVGAFRIRDYKYAPFVQQQTKQKVYFEMFARTCYSDKLGPKPSDDQPGKWEGFMKEFYDWTQNISSEDERHGWTSQTGWNPCWKTKEDDKLPQLLFEAAQSFGMEAEYLNEHSWLEIGAFAQKSDNKLDISAIGPTIDHVHNIMETLYLDTVPPMFQMILYVLNKLKGKES